ncbi:MAG: hypothetical protein J6R80_00985 [Kiritimatiellae bacterium]|jgi:hypothetical protein|nr:hypothetical protein [Kiritimatiellia bacterium]
MKCEICNKSEAETAIIRGEGESAEELYVCKACAKAERQRRQNKSLRTRKVTGLPPGVSMSITEISRDGADMEPPPFLGAIVNAFHDMVSDMEKARSEAEKEAKRKSSVKMTVYPASQIAQDFRLRGHIHLEALHLIGELDAVRRAIRALGGELVGIDVDGVHDAGHIYTFKYSCSPDCADRVVADLLESERSARVRLFEELPRVFGDCLCRALAIMKNCRLLSPGELFDLLSPMCLAAKEDMLDGIAFSEIKALIRDIDLSSFEDKLDQEARDEADAARADEINRKFEEVILNERAEGRFL